MSITIPDGLHGKPLFDWLEANEPELLGAFTAAIHAEIVVWAYDNHPEECRRITKEMLDHVTASVKAERWPK